MAAELPSGTVTFLFTDLEGSTRLWERYPEAMKVCLAKHDAILREAVHSNGGHIVKTTGDGLMAVFASGVEGITATIAAQNALVKETWEGIQPNRLRVRMGLHTGEAELRDGDYYGSVLNRAARLMSIAHGGQILLTSATAELFRERLPAHATLQDLGEHRLKDLVRPDHVYQLCVPELPSEFPPIQSLDSFPNNLPIQLTSFIGRERELKETQKKLSSTRLLTLTGSGGTGKTRLALQLAAEVLNTFADGVWFVELAPVTEPALILQVIAQVLGVREQLGMTLTDITLDYVRAKQMLMVLDNCEHLVDACARLADQLLRASPRLKIIATSREALGISGEAIYHVPSLSLPQTDQVTSQALAHVEAVQLFLERAAAANPKFSLTETNAVAIAQICTHLDGIPLALELAAARVPVLAPEQIAARLEDRFKLLTAGSRTAVPRQQTLRAMIDWSYETLGEDERALLRRLSVFSGGWTLEAAEALCSDLDVLNVLTLLVNKSLVVVDEAGRESRYGLLETIRQYAREKLLEAGETERLRTQHLAYFVELAERGGEKMIYSDPSDWLPPLKVEHDNFRVAEEWALDTDVDAALRLVGALSAFWFRRGLTFEGITRTSEALERAERLPALEGEAGRQRMAIHARAWQSLAYLAYLNTNSVALKACEECIVLARLLGDNRLLGTSLSIAGSVRVLMGDTAGARASLEEGLRIARANGDKHVIGMTLVMMAHYSSMVEHDFEAARAYEDEGLAALEGNETSWAGVNTFFGIARSARLRGDNAAARARFMKLLPMFERIGDEHRVNMIASELAHMDRHEGHAQQAEAAYRKTIRVWQRLGHRAAIAHQLESFGFAAKAQEQPERAARLFAAAEALREKISIPMDPQERTEYDVEVAALRAGMDEAAFSAAWTAGRNLTMEQAIDYATGKTLPAA